MTHSESIYRRSWPVSCVALVHIAAPWLVAVGAALVAMAAHGASPDPTAPPFVVVAVSCLFLVEVPGHQRIWADWQQPSDSTSILVRWLIVVAILAVVCLTTPLLRTYQTAAGYAWAVLTPLLLVSTNALTLAALRSLMLRSLDSRSAVMIGYSTPGVSLSRRLAARPGLFMQFVGFFDDRSSERLGAGASEMLLGKLADAPAFVKSRRVDLVFVALPLAHAKRVMPLFAQLQDCTASIYYVPDAESLDLALPEPSQLDGIPVIPVRETPFFGYRLLIKRLTDVVLASIFIVLASPVLVACAVLIRLGSPGPVIFRQQRYGFDGREIEIYKFRTMTVIEDRNSIRQATRSDPRVTPIGRFLRRTSLDELPQLFNVMQGTMSIVGPRPHCVAQSEEYRKLVKGFMVRHKALPGITGLAQINGCRGEIGSVEDISRRVHYDLAYIRGWSLSLDLRIMLQTVVRIFRDDDAY